MTGTRRVQGVAWVPEYSGNDSTWRVFRTTSVTLKRKAKL